MGILERFEQRVERLIGSNLSQAESGEVQPVDMASALIQELDDCATIAGIGQVVVHNSFAIDLAPSDFRRVSDIESPLRIELVNVVKEHIGAQKYTSLGSITITFAHDSALPTGVFRVTGETTDHGGNTVMQFRMR